MKAHLRAQAVKVVVEFDADGGLARALSAKHEMFFAGFDPVEDGCVHAIFSLYMRDEHQLFYYMPVRFLSQP